MVVIFNDGSLKKVFLYYYFYDEVFKIMFFEDKFLLYFFIIFEWFLFLKIIGFICEVF